METKLSIYWAGVNKLSESLREQCAAQTQQPKGVDACWIVSLGRNGGPAGILTEASYRRAAMAMIDAPQDAALASDEQISAYLTREDGKKKAKQSHGATALLQKA